MIQAAPDDRRARAAARLAAAAPDAWYFALLGLAPDVDEVKLDVGARLAPVADPPSEVELAAALHEPRLFAVMGRWAPAIRHELVLDRSHDATPKAAIDLASLIVTALRMRTAADLMLPALADHSWSTLAAIADGRCTAALLDDALHVRACAQGASVSAADLEWAWRQAAVIAALLPSARVRLGVDALATHRRDGNPRLAAVKLWAGIEAVCGVEPGPRLAAAVAALLEPRGPARLELYESMARLVAARAQVLHSELLAGEDVHAHVREARGLLARLLCAVVEARRAPGPSDVERCLFA